jgi:protein-S-isoprenylcysteine O-methyltransferase Ste14
MTFLQAPGRQADSQAPRQPVIPRHDPTRYVRIRAMAAAALAIVLFELAVVERVLRAGRGRSFTMRASDRGTTWLTAAAPLALLAGAVPVRLWLGPGRVALGPVVAGACFATMAAGVALRVAAMHTLGEFFTRTLVTFDDQELIERGPYRWLRHPGYLARLLVFLPGILVLSSNALYAALVAAVYTEVYRRRTAAEEAMLLARFGDAYAAYRSRTWRLVPLVW